MTTAITSRDQILNRVKALKQEAVRIPEWDRDGSEATVYVRAMSALERHVVNRKIKDQDSEARAWLATQVVVDAEGARVFNDKDVKALNDGCFGALDKIFDVAIRLSEVDLAAAKKNSEKTQSDN